MVEQSKPAVEQMLRGEGKGAARPLIFIPTLTAGGAERVASLLANEWSASLKVVLVTYFDEPIFYGLDRRVSYFNLGLKPNRSTLLRVADIVRAALRLRKVARNAEPTFVLSFMNKYNAFCLAALAGTGLPVVVSERDSPTEKLPVSRVLFRDLSYPLAAGLIAQTEDALAFISGRTFLRRAQVIPNPVHRHLDPFFRQPEKIILTVGRLVPKKGQEQLLQAFSRMKAAEWRLVVCGDGPLRARLERQALELGIASRVEFLGLVKCLDTQFARAGIFAFPSLFEGYPNALAEAMVSGLPCVSYDCPTGPADLIQSGENGILVNTGDVAALAEALDRLAANTRLAESLGRRAARLADELSPAVIANRYLRFCLEAAVS